METAMDGSDRVLSEEEVRPLIDRLGELDERIRDLEVQKKVAEQDARAIRNELLEVWEDVTPADELVVASGERYRLTISANELRRQICDKPRLRRILGAELFNRLWEITLADIDRYVPIEKHKLFLERERTGPRSITTNRIVTP